MQLKFSVNQIKLYSKLKTTKPSDYGLNFECLLVF